MRISIQPGRLERAVEGARDAHDPPLDGLVAAAALGFLSACWPLGPAVASNPLVTARGRRALLAASAASGCELVSVSADYVAAQPPGGASARREAILLSRVVDWASQVGARRVSLSIDAWPEGPRALRERLEPALDTAAESGTVLALRSSAGAEVLRALIAELGHPMLQASFDPARAAIDGRSATRELDELGPALCEVRLIDCDAAGVPCPLGSGVAGWSDLVPALAARRFSGDLVLCDDGGPDPRFSALRALNFIRVGVSRASQASEHVGDAA